ncbi:trehalose-6-phosphate hydrolase-like [Belonocnema kinseyi]|uniref:trehalose-6-phosphate hydrolase-like n=1 Tax=Belonocnema kinseyi TaxID=2817044 RepID=UPI00143DB919|nr:trehalose-6-phosphate hydrolase-like [Belonocnema kinseyi]
MTECQESLGSFVQSRKNTNRVPNFINDQENLKYPDYLTVVLAIISKLTLLYAVLTGKCVHDVSERWWNDAIVYQVYLWSFNDIDVIWLLPIYTSPQPDTGYDITNFTEVDPQYGILVDFTKLVTMAKALDLRDLLDFVSKHTSYKTSS